MTKWKKTSSENIVETEEGIKTSDTWVGETLNPKQELFCQIYSSDGSCFGNGVDSYMEVYDVDKSKPNWYKTACAAASRLLSNVKICKRINELLEEQWLNDGFVDKQLLFLLSQHDEKSVKLWAIKEYNALKARITQKIETKNETVITLSDEEQKNLLKLLWK